MEKRLQYFFLALTVLAAGMVSCTREVVSDHAVKGLELTFTAIHADSKDTKTALLPGTHSQGLLIGYSKADYSGATKVIDKSITVHRSVFGRLFELDNGLTFTMGGGSAAAVDLGLPSGLKWASCNVGASTPEEYGGFFAWGETELKSKYTWGTYKWGNSYDKLTKYCTQSSYWDNPDPMDKKTVLDPEDDAAHVNWGDSWRMPTDAEWTELRCNCSWDWTTQNGVKGRLVTGPNGNSIFLPATGGHGGSFWSSSLDMDIPSNACLVAFNSSEYSVPTDFRGVSERCAGCSVRPVTE